MQNIVFVTIVVVLVTLWALGYYVYNLGSTIHLVLLIAGLAVVLRFMKEKQYK
jgi:hypothetical protein